ncbi:MAG: prepilin peptidase [Merdibacter sp.]
MISLLCGMLALNALLRHYQAQLRPLSLVLLTAGAWGLSVCADDLRTAFFRDAQLLTLIAIAQIDRKRMIIPDRLSLALLIVGLLSGNLPSLGQMLIGMSVPALLMLAMDHLWKPCFGMGDIKLCLVCGMLRGTDFLRALQLSLIASARLLLIESGAGGQPSALAPWIVLADAASLLEISLDLLL